MTQGGGGSGGGVDGAGGRWWWCRVVMWWHLEVGGEGVGEPHVPREGREDQVPHLGKEGEEENEEKFWRVRRKMRMKKI